MTTDAQSAISVDDVGDDAARSLWAWGVAQERWRAAVADLLGLRRADTLALEALSQVAMTPARLGTAVGLTSGGVTALVQRLEAGGCVRREPHAEDRRSVVIAAAPAAMRAVGRPHDDLLRALGELFASGDPHRMWILCGFLDDALRLLDSKTRGLRDEIASRDRRGRDDDHEALWH